MKPVTALISCAFIAILASASLTAHAQNAVTDAQVQQKAEQILEEENAKKVFVEVEVTPKLETNENVNFIDFTQFDINQDGVLSRDEVGETLFYVFDKDKNSLIDNIEMKKVGIIALTPMTKTTLEIIDYGSARKPQKTVVSEEDFLEQSQLAKFDKDNDGLSPLDFLGMSFNAVNVHDDGVIDLYEFQRAYAKSVRPLHEESFMYND